MTKIDLSALNHALDALPKRHPGPGGVAGVMKDGKVIASRCWGYSNVDSAAPMTAGTRLPICSISKQFTCQVLLTSVDDPARWDAYVSRYLPRFTGQLPTVRQLCHNQSGLRDYWALTVLQGALAEQVFGREDALPLIQRMKTGHFAPGSQYSYCNCNFRIVSELIEAETGESLEALYRRHIWQPAGMTSATLTADTSQPEDGVVGYEGNDDTGFFPASNAIYWIGDAGISASLDDMMNYEAWIDATRNDATSLYRRIAERPSFSDGAQASYGYGLAHETIAGLAFTGHAGALRGFRAQRLNCREARLSVVVMFNHEGSTHAAAESLIRAALGHKASSAAPIPDGWDGQWLSPDGLLARIESQRRSATLHYATVPDTLELSSDGALAAPGVTVHRTENGLSMLRSGDNAAAALAVLPPVDAADGADIAGHYHSSELDATLEIATHGGGVYARFTGMLGTGRMERMAPAGEDVWTVATRRSMDAPAPGDWTLQLRRNDQGRVTGLTIGCWLARGLDYVTVSAAG
jgi:D-aminopeptidase